MIVGGYVMVGAILTRDERLFRKIFDGKVVLLGTVLDVEDRKITSKRFATQADGWWEPRCPVKPRTWSTERPERFARDSIPGVYIHATAVNNLIRGDSLVEYGRAFTGLASFALAALAGMIDAQDVGDRPALAQGERGGAPLLGA